MSLLTIDKMNKLIRSLYEKLVNLIELHSSDRIQHITDAERKRWNSGVSDGTVSVEDLELVKTYLEGKITNPKGDVAEFNSISAANDLYVGKRGPVGPPNFNNLYCSGSIYMGPKNEFFNVTGPGAVGGNIYLPPGKAICGVTKDGPIAADPANGINGDSGVRTIGFVGQVMEEDVMNNETSVYIGTNVSRLYLYSKTAYPMIVTKKEVIKQNDDIEYLEGSIAPNEMVETISPIASQEWVQMLLEQLGLLGGKEDTTIYTAANINPYVSFNATLSSDWTSATPLWVLNSNGVIGHTKNTGRVRYAPLFQNPGWNEIYFKVNSQSWNDLSILVMQTPTHAYGFTVENNTYKTFAIDKNGTRMYDYQSPLKPSLEEANLNGYVCRMKIDETNKAFVLSYIDAENNETVVLNISQFTFSGFVDYTNATPCLGLCVNISLTINTIIQIVDRPKGFDPSMRLTYSEFGVIRQRDLTDVANTTTLDEIIDRKVEERLQELINSYK